MFCGYLRDCRFILYGYDAIANSFIFMQFSVLFYMDMMPLIVR